MNNKVEFFMLALKNKIIYENILTNVIFEYWINAAFFDNSRKIFFDEKSYFEVTVSFSEEKTDAF